MCTKSEDALSSVVAIMLLLAIVVTFISIYSAVYVPSLKEQAEIEHIGEVEHAFLKFGSDIEKAASMKDEISLSETVPLGGGDVLFNPMKSSGSLMVRQENDPLVSVTLGKSGISQVLKTQLINYSYHPSFSFWEKQGYVWRYGYINVTKSDVETPLSYCEMKDVINAANYSGFASTLVSFDAERNVTSGNNNCSAVRINLVNFIAGEHNYVSGNGMGKLMLRVNDSVTYRSLPEDLAIRVNKDLALSEFSTRINQKTRRELEEMSNAYGNINEFHVAETNDFDTINVGIDQSVTPVEVYVRIVGIEVSVQ